MPAQAFPSMALTLEKMKHAEGEVLYVTHSAYLAQNARDLYYANGFEHPGQEAVFLSYREFVESIRVPPGREASWRDFAGWFARMRQAFKGIDAHQAFEEIRGVIAADAGAVLTRDAYRALGVRQSIFYGDERELLYDLFEKYRAWLAEAKLFDLNLVAHNWQTLAAPRYDFVVIDEVQDITSVQLALVLKALKKPGHFLLCGDSNQIVHPNFFSWGQVKSLFWRDPQLAERQQLQVLTANFRNGTEATRVANQLLKIKQRRFGSIDRESNFLVQAVGGDTGQVALVQDKDAVKKEQADAIRRNILRQTPVPWPVFDEAKTTELLVKVFREQAPGSKQRQQLYEIATCYDEPALAAWLVQEAKFDAAKNFQNQRVTVRRKMRDGEAWVPVYQALNLAFIGEFAWDFVWDRVDAYLEMAGLPKRGVPIAGERAVARWQAAEREREQREAAARQAHEQWRAVQIAAQRRTQEAAPKWGTPEAKRREIERIRKEIEEKKKR